MKRAFSVLAIGLVALSSYAQELQGADAALREAAQRRQSTKAGGLKTGLKGEIEAFRSGRGLEPQAAATGWLKLYDAYGKSEGSEPVQFSALVGALPAPEAWNAIAAGLSQRIGGKRDSSAQSAAFFVATLRGDVAARGKL